MPEANAITLIDSIEIVTVAKSDLSDYIDEPRNANKYVTILADKGDKVTIYLTTAHPVVLSYSLNRRLRPGTFRKYLTTNNSWTLDQKLTSKLQ